MAFIDIVAYSLFTVIVSLIVGHAVEMNPNSDLNYLVSFIVTILIPIIITFLLWKYKGGSVGKITRKTRIVDIKSGNPPTNKQLVLRMLGSFLSGFSFFLSHLNVAVDSRKQSWHDKLSETCIINDSKREDYKFTPSPFPIKRDKVFTTIGISIVSILLIGCLTISYIALQDDELLPGAAKWMNPEKFVEDNPRDNGFYYLIGLDCKEDADPYTVGYEYVKRNNEQIEEIKENFAFTLSRTVKSLPINDDFVKTNHFSVNKNTTIDSILIYSDLIENAYNSMTILHDRYEKIESFSYFNNSLTPHTYSTEPFIINVVNYNRMMNYKILKDYYNGDTGAIDRLIGLIHTNQFAFRNSCTLLNILEFTIVLNQNMHTLSLILDMDDELNYNDINEKINYPERINWDPIWKHQNLSYLSYGLSLYNGMTLYPENEYKIENFINNLNIRYKLKINKLINSYYTDYLKWRDISTLNGFDYYVTPNDSPKFEFNRIDNFLNPLGERLNISAFNINGRYIGKEHDLHGLFTLFKLKLMILEQKIAPKDIPEFLESQAANFHNPFTYEAISWDKENSTIYFTNHGYGLNDEERTELKLNLKRSS